MQVNETKKEEQDGEGGDEVIALNNGPSETVKVQEKHPICEISYQQQEQEAANLQETNQNDPSNFAEN